MNKRMGLLLPIVVAVFALFACGGSSGPDARDLQARSEVFNKAYLDANWGKVYEFFTPDFRSEVSRDDFEGNILTKEDIRLSLGVDEDAELKVRVTSASINAGEGNIESRGEATVQIHQDEQQLSSEVEEWVFVDGQWWLTRESWLVKVLQG